MSENKTALVYGEIDSLKQRVELWQAYYEKNPDDIDMFYFHLDDVLRPYVERLVEVGILTKQERTDFLGWAFEKAALIEARGSP